MRARSLVTGGAGFIGSHLVAALLARGDDCVVFDNFLTGHRAAVSAGARIAEGDLADAKKVDDLLQDGRFDTVFHLADLSLVGRQHAVAAALPYRQPRQCRAPDRILRAPWRKAVRVLVHRQFVRRRSCRVDRRNRGDRAGVTLWREQVDDRAHARVSRPHPRPTLSLFALLQRRWCRSRGATG